MKIKESATDRVSSCCLSRISLPNSLSVQSSRNASMPSNNKTIAAVSNPRSRQPANKTRAPLTTEQKKEKQHDSDKNKTEMDDALREFICYYRCFFLTCFVEALYANIHEQVQALAERFDKSTRYFLDIVFQGGARMVNQQEKINPYNAFKSEKAAEHRESTYLFSYETYTAPQITTDGEALKAPELHRLHHEEYLLLTEEERAELVERFSETRNEPKMRRATPRGRVQHVANTARNMQLLVRHIHFYLPH